MSNIWLTADLHLGDDRMHLFPRPFSSATSCATRIISNWNAAVEEGDTVYVVGDFAIDPHWLKLASQLKGKKILLKGNYDTCDDDAYLQYFEAIEESVNLDLKNPENGDVLSVHIQHYPGKSVPDLFNLVGHIHGAWRVQKNMLNVGVDVWHYAPVSVENVFFMYNGICSFYDQDVWVGNHPANTAHNERGKAGTYWERGYGGSRTDLGERVGS